MGIFAKKIADSKWLNSKKCVFLLSETNEALYDALIHYIVTNYKMTDMKKTIKWFITTSLMVMVCLHVTAQSNADQFDLYNEIAEQSSDPSSYYAIVDSYKDQVGTMSESDIANAKAALRTALFTLMNIIPAKSGQYDITSFVKNPSFTNVTTSGWWWNSTTTINDWTVTNDNSFTVNNKSGVAEYFGVMNSSQIYQVIENMPAGDYTVKVQGFYRNGEWKQALANYERGLDAVKGSIYVDAPTNAQPLKSIFSDGCNMLTCKSNKSADVYAIVSGRGFPHSHTGSGSNPSRTPDIAKQAFEHGHYWNEMTVHHGDGDLTIGISLTSGAPAETWIAIDNFRLYYGTPSSVTITESTTFSDDTYAEVVLKKHFNAEELTPLAVPCDIPASKFRAVYAIGSLDEDTKTAVLCPVDHVSANVPCYVVANEDADEMMVESTYISAAQFDQIPVMWDGGLVYRVPNTFSWKMTTVSEQELDASYFTHFEYVDPIDMDFTANIENFRARQFLENTDYSDPNAKSVISDFFKPAPPRLDIPHNIGVPIPASKMTNVVVKFGLDSDFSDAQSRTVLAGSDMAYMPNLIPGNTYYFKVEAGSEVLTQGKFLVEGPVRMIYAPSISNIRDLGGWNVQGGKQVRYGLIFRGGEANGQHSSVAEDRQTLIDLGVGAEVDLRSDNSYDSGNGQVGKCAFGFGSNDYFFSEGCRDSQVGNLTNATSKNRFKGWFNFILNHIREGKAVYFHCVWGADRTGLTAVLLQGLLGLSQEQMDLEYELTSLSFAGNRPKGGTPNYGDHLALIEKIKTYDGVTLRDKFDTYWTKEVGISMEQIEEFRSIMLLDSREKVSITLGDLGVGTYYSSKALDFSEEKKMNAYIVSTFKPATGQVTLTRVTEVPANTGIIVKGEAGTYEIPVGEGNIFVANMLKGVETPTVMHKKEGEYTNFILAQKDGNVGFYLIKDGTTLGANKAYLQIPTDYLPSTSPSAKFRLIFDGGGNGEPTAILEIDDQLEEEQTDIYNLNGQRIESLQRGMNLVGGKIIYVK